MEGFDSYFLLLPSGAGGHRDTDRLRLVAGLHGYDAWLLGYRDEGLRHGRQRVAVLPLVVLGAPAGEIGAALAAAGALRGCDYVLPPGGP